MLVRKFTPRILFRASRVRATPGTVLIIAELGHMLIHISDRYRQFRMAKCPLGQGDFNGYVRTLLRGNRRNRISDAGRFGGGADNLLTITFSRCCDLVGGHGGECQD
jgi:hypothetical protein